MNCRVGFWIVSVYGPAPGIFVDVLNGDFAAGVGAALTSPIAKRNLLSGALSVHDDLRRSCCST